MHFIGQAKINRIVKLRNIKDFRDVGERLTCLQVVLIKQQWSVCLQVSCFIWANWWCNPNWAKVEDAPDARRKG